MSITEPTRPDLASTTEEGDADSAPSHLPDLDEIAELTERMELAELTGVLPAEDLRREFTRFRLRYKFALDEVTTKISILREEFEETHDHSPIEHVRTRLKTADSLIEKVTRVGCAPTLEAIEQEIRDIAGVRVVCPFVSDVYWISDMLTSQPDVTVLEVEDYIIHPKANGYRSLHLIISVPIYLSDRTEHVPVELQIRTIAMDFWASVEHSIYYKYDGTVPVGLLDELQTAAQTAASLDATMSQLREEVRPPQR